MTIIFRPQRPEGTGCESVTIDQIYPAYTPDEISEADDTLQKYVGLVWRIYSRYRSEKRKNLTRPPLNARFKRPRA